MALANQKWCTNEPTKGVMFKNRPVKFNFGRKKSSAMLGGRRFLPQAPRSYPIPMAHRVTPGKPEVTPGTKSYWHTVTTPSLVWQTNM